MAIFISLNVCYFYRISSTLGIISGTFHRIRILTLQCYILLLYNVYNIRQWAHAIASIQTLIKRRSRVIYWAPIRFQIIYEFLEARGPLKYIYTHTHSGYNLLVLLIVGTFQSGPRLSVENSTRFVKFKQRKQVGTDQTVNLIIFFFVSIPNRGLII